MKKVLVITYYWPPSGGSGVQRWLKFCKYLPSSGWQPVVYAPLNPEYNSIDKSLEADIPREAVVLKHRINEPYALYRRLMGKGSSTSIDALTSDKATAGEGDINPISKGHKSLRQRISLFIRANCFVPDPRCLWVWPSVRFLKKYLSENPVDVIVTTGPPHSVHLIGRRLSKITGLPWVADFRDPWTKMYYYKNLPLMRWADAKQRRQENMVLKDATKVLTVTPLMKADFSAMTDTPIEVITNGYDEEDFDQIVEDTGFFNLTHTGLFSSDGDPVVLWKVLEGKCRKDPEFKKSLRIRLAGKTDEGIWKSLERADLEENVVDLGYQSHIHAVREQLGASLLILPLRQDPDYRPILPGKVFEYLAAKRPILGIGQEDGAMAMLLKETGAGVVCDWNNEKAISDYIDDCWNKFQSDTLDCASVWVERFSRRNLTLRLASMLDSIIEDYEQKTDE